MLNCEDLSPTFGSFKGIIPGQSVCTKGVRWGRWLRKASGNRLTFDTKGWNHCFRRADRSLSADVTFFFMGSSLLRIRNS